MRVVVYARTSTQDQFTANQTEALRAWVAQRGWDMVAEYVEQESAWKAGHQRELSRLLTDAHRGQFDAVAVWALDRISREGPLAILTLVHRLRARGVAVISYQEPWTEAPGEIGDLLLSLTGWVAQQESKRRSERTRAGLARAAKEGRYPGRPPGSKDKRKRKKRSRRVGPFWGTI